MDTIIKALKDAVVKLRDEKYQQEKNGQAKAIIELLDRINQPQLTNEAKEKIENAIHCLTDDDGYPYPDKPLIKRACDYLNEFRDMMNFYKIIK